MNHEPSQFCGPPTREGATLKVPLPQSATLSDMCVNGPIVYECLDSVLRSQVHLLQRDAPTWAPSSPPWWARPGVRLRVSHVRENGRMSCVCLAACVTGSVQGWVRTHAETGKRYKYNIWRETKLRNATIRLARFQERNSAFERGWSWNPWKEELWIWEKKNHCHHKDYILFWII